MSWWDTAKELASLAAQLDNVEITRNVLQLQGEMMELQAKLAAAQEENRTLKEQLSARQEMMFEDNAYWRRGGSSREGPFCPGCFDDRSKAIRMQSHRNISSMKDHYECPICHNTVDDPHAPQRPRRHSDGSIELG